MRAIRMASGGGRRGCGGESLGRPAPLTPEQQGGFLTGEGGALSVPLWRRNTGFPDRLSKDEKRGSLSGSSMGLHWPVEPFQSPLGRRLEGKMRDAEAGSSGGLQRAS